MPSADYLSLGHDWAQGNTRRVELAWKFLGENDELLNLLYQALPAVDWNRHRQLLAGGPFAAYFLPQSNESLEDLAEQFARAAEFCLQMTPVRLPLEQSSGPLTGRVRRHFLAVTQN
jgi:hypothetical protein